MELGPASPPPPPPPQPPTPPPNVYEPDSILQIRQQMFPLILTTYGIPTDSERARSLAILLGMNECQNHFYNTVNVLPRIGYHQQWGGPSHPLLPNYAPFSNIPDDVLSHVVSYLAVPHALMCRWYNISKQWQRCFTTPLLGYYDFLRMCQQLVNSRTSTLDPIESSRPPIPRPYTPSVAVMRCMNCQKSSIMEQCDGGSMWGHCWCCSTDGQFEMVKGEAGEVINRFPHFIKAKAQESSFQA